VYLRVHRLAYVQAYTTNSDPRFGKGHGPHCQHARDGLISLDPGYDLLTVAEPLPEPVDLGQYRARRQTHVSGLINEYRLVA
jgi:hypothetical protein